MIVDHTPFGSAAQAEPFITLPRLRGARAVTPPSPAIDDLAQLRRKQIDVFGHTPASDLRLPLAYLPGEARRAVTGLFEDIQFNRHHLLRGHTIKAAALLIAFADRLDAEATLGETA